MPRVMENLGARKFSMTTDSTGTGIRLHEAFNRTALSKFLNRPAGRIFRVAAGTGFLVIGLLFRQKTLGLAAMIWSVFPITAGAFDVCYISAVLGGPFAGTKIRQRFGSR